MWNFSVLFFQTCFKGLKVQQCYKLHKATFMTLKVTEKDDKSSVNENDRPARRVEAKPNVV